MSLTRVAKGMNKFVSSVLHGAGGRNFKKKEWTLSGFL
jgi:hypothetical protein